jgi:F0F1-type ATP synthase membrane subunit b/b'
MEIFVQLGADSSLIYQSVIVLVVLILAKLLFLNHLENVLVKREEATTGLESNAEKQFEEIENLQKQYDSKISNAHKSIKSDTDESKADITKRLEELYKTNESKVNAEVDKKREEAQAIAKAQKEEILSSTEELSELLVSKVTKG